MPESLKVAALAGSHREKELLGAAVEGAVPALIRTRSKRPFWAPPQSAVSTSALAELVQDVLRSNVAGSVPMLHRAGIRALLDSIPLTDPAHRGSLDSLLLSLTSLVLLQERYGIRDD
jgi:hypothetical protein